MQLGGGHVRALRVPKWKKEQGMNSEDRERAGSLPRGWGSGGSGRSSSWPRYSRWAQAGDLGLA